MIISRKRMDEEVNRRVKEELEQEYQSRKFYELQKDVESLRAQMETIRAEHAQEVAVIKERSEQLTDGIVKMLDAIGALEAAHTCDGSDGDDVLVWTESAKKE